jgi:uncharacterized protein YjbI with pentapeptide repeats
VSPDLRDHSPADDPLQTEGVYDELRFSADALLRASAAGARFLDCVLEGTDLTEARLDGSRWTECDLRRVRGVGVQLSDAALLDCRIDEPRLGAVAAYGSTWRRVTVRGGKVDYLNLRGATLRDVRFVDCVLAEPDFGGATLTDVTFDGCTLTGPQWSGATLSTVDLSGARLVAPQGLTSLRGATISRSQLLDLADAFADQLGVRVDG